MEQASDENINENVNSLNNIITVKKENLHEDDIKEFAETAMSELLGWYGYENPRDETILLPSSSTKPGIDSKITNTTSTNTVGVEGKRAQLTAFAGHNNGDSPVGSPKVTDTDCGWCGEMVDESGGISSSTANYCSELCFTQSRRASFKRHKTCDWCRQVRNSISYVDFQDGVSQLQFCSDRCLNQYKMHIFCRETRAHLQMHPHLPTDTSSGNLITPDLWLRNCKSPLLNVEDNINSAVTSNLNSDGICNNTENSNKKNSLQTEEEARVKNPCISVVPPSKLMSTAVNLEKRQKLKNNSNNSNKKKRNFITLCTKLVSKNNNSNNNNQPEDLRIFKPNITLRDFEKNETIRNVHCRTDKPDINITSINENGKKIFSNLLPPATMLIPYPILLPVPLPLPIPIPVPENLIKEYFPQSSLNIDKADAGNELIKTTNIQQTDNKNTNEEDISDGNKMEFPLNLDIKKINKTKSDLPIVDSNKKEKSDSRTNNVNNVMFNNNNSSNQSPSNVETKIDNIVENVNKSADCDNEINLRPLRKRRKVWSNNINHFNTKNNTRKRNK